MDNEGHDDITTTFRELASGKLESSVNQHAYQSFSLMSRGFIDKALARNQETVTTVADKIDVSTYDGSPNNAVDNFTRALNTQIISGKLTFKIRNNCNVPVKLSCWKLRPKQRFPQNSNPVTSIQEGLVASGLDATAITDIRYTPNDSDAFKRHYKVLSLSNVTIAPGGEKTYTLSRNTPFKYSHDETLSHTASYTDPKFTQFLLFKTTGVIGHSSGVDQKVGRMPATLDFEEMEQIKFEQVSNSFAHSHQSGDYLPTLPLPPIATAIDTNTNEADCDIQDTIVTAPVPVN